MGAPALQPRDVAETRQSSSQVESSIPSDTGRLCSPFQAHVCESTMNYYLSVMWPSPEDERIKAIHDTDTAVPISPPTHKTFLSVLPRLPQIQFTGPPMKLEMLSCAILKPVSE